jgi:hypothetical protein
MTLCLSSSTLSSSALRLISCWCFSITAIASTAASASSLALAAAAPAANDASIPEDAATPAATNVACALLARLAGGTLRGGTRRFSMSALGLLSYSSGGDGGAGGDFGGDGGGDALNGSFNGSFPTVSNPAGGLDTVIALRICVESSARPYTRMHHNLPTKPLPFPSAPSLPSALVSALVALVLALVSPTASAPQQLGSYSSGVRGPSFSFTLLSDSRTPFPLEAGEAAEEDEAADFLGFVCPQILPSTYRSILA